MKKLKKQSLKIQIGRIYYLSLTLIFIDKFEYFSIKIKIVIKF